MIHWVVVALVCLLLYLAPIFIFNIVINLFSVLSMLCAALCRWGYHEIVAISHTAMIILTLPDYIQMRMAGRASHVDDTTTPNELSQTGNLVNHTITPNATSSVDGPVCGLVQRCGGKTSNGAWCKREKKTSTDQAERWFCKDHIKQRLG